MTDTTEYLAEDFKFTLDLLKRYASGPGQDTPLFLAVCTHNLGIILAALDIAEAAAPSEAPEEEP